MYDAYSRFMRNLVVVNERDATVVRDGKEVLRGQCVPLMTRAEYDATPEGFILLRGHVDVMCCAGDDASRLLRKDQVETIQANMVSHGWLSESVIEVFPSLINYAAPNAMLSYYKRGLEYGLGSDAEDMVELYVQEGNHRFTAYSDLVGERLGDAMQGHVLSALYRCGFVNDGLIPVVVAKHSGMSHRVLGLGINAAKAAISSDPKFGDYLWFFMGHLGTAAEPNIVMTQKDLAKSVALTFHVRN